MTATNEVECFGNLTDAELCDLVRRNWGEVVDEEDEDEENLMESMPKVSHNETLIHLSKLRKYLEDNFTEYSAFYEIEEMIERNVLSHQVQKKITDFFFTA